MSDSDSDSNSQAAQAHKAEHVIKPAKGGP
jgi:hypothetical protein